MPTSLLVIIAILGGAVGNTLIKMGTSQIPALSFEMTTISRAISNPSLVVGLILLLASFPLYTASLQRLPLNVAFPLITSGTFVIAAILSYFFLKESLTLVNIAGIFLLIIGLWLVSK